MKLAASRIVGRLAIGVLALPLTLSDAAAHQGQLCSSAIRAAERRLDLPAGLLMAVALTETGRRVGDLHTPWPWSINAAGDGAWLEDRGAAIERTRALQASGVESIDVGCMQVNLRWHAEAFDSLRSAFDPRTNVAYAASHLKELRARSRDWLEAVGRYHSADPARARPYLARVRHNWEAALAGLEGGGMLLPAAPGQIPLDLLLPRAGEAAPLVDLTAARPGTPLFDARYRPLLGAASRDDAGSGGP